MKQLLQPKPVVSVFFKVFYNGQLLFSRANVQLEELYFHVIRNVESQTTFLL